MIILQSTKVKINTIQFFSSLPAQENARRSSAGHSRTRSSKTEDAKISQKSVQGRSKMSKTSHHPKTQKTCHFPAHNVTEKGELQINGGGNS